MCNINNNPKEPKAHAVVLKTWISVLTFDWDEGTCCLHGTVHINKWMCLMLPINRGNGLSPWAKGVKLQLSIQSTSHVSYKLCDYQMIMRCKRGTHFNTPAEQEIERGRRGSLMPSQVRCMCVCIWPARRAKLMRRQAVCVWMAVITPICVLDIINLALMSKCCHFKLVITLIASGLGWPSDFIICISRYKSRAPHHHQKRLRASQYICAGERELRWDVSSGKLIISSRPRAPRSHNN